VEPVRKPANPRVGYYFAALNALISGVAIYVNSIGVKTFSDSTLYTALKNAVVGIAVLIPLVDHTQFLYVALFAAMFLT
jgi:hypothetical protein